MVPAVNPPTTSHHVVVIGAGAAGLVAARELRREGHSVGAGAAGLKYKPTCCIMQVKIINKQITITMDVPSHIHTYQKLKTFQNLLVYSN
ncbi:putative FAD/NAD(P)-binding domain superfamily [Arabidopsis thaliana]